MPEWSTSIIGPHVSRRIEPVALDGNESYKTLGIRYKSGVYVRAVKTGNAIRTKMFRARSGNFIYCVLDSQRGPFDIVPPELDEGLVTSKFPTYQVLPSLVPEYLLLAFQGKSTLDAIGKERTGSEGRSEWKPEMFEAHVIPMPPLPVQRKMVEMLDAVDTAIRATALEAERLAVVLKIRRAALANDTRFAEVSAQEAFDIRLGRQRSPARATGPSMTPYLRSANVGYDELRLDDVMSMDFDERERERYALQDGDVLVSEGSAGANAVGMPAAWHGEIEGPICFQNTLLRYRAIEDVSTPEFVRQWCLWAYESGTFRDVAPDGVNIKHIGDTRAKVMPVRLPGIDEQRTIAAQLLPLSEAVRSLRDEAARLRVARAALLDALLTRKVEPSV